MAMPDELAWDPAVLLEREVEPGPVSKRGDSTVEMVDARHDATILGHPTAKCGVVIGDSVR